jgi:NADH:ubiquinone reductase (H+-translocating)
MESGRNVVIIGGGFGGLYAARALRKAPVSVTLIDRRNFHLFQPLLYQVATGGLSPGDVAAPLRSVLRKQKNARVLLGNVVDIDTQRREVVTEDQQRIPYDWLVVATGSRHSYFGHNDWEQFVPGLKTIENATEMRRRILYAFERAEIETDVDRQREWLTFVIVGGGPTGVELAGTLGEIANDTLKDDFRNVRPELARILILDNSSRVLPVYPPDLSESAEESLIKLGVRTRNNVLVTGVDETGVTIRRQDGGTEKIASRTVLWAAGVEPSPLGRLLAERTAAPVDRTGRPVVQPDCSLPGHPQLFVIGDLAHCTDDKGNLLPGVAPVAMQQGRYVATAIQKRLQGEVVQPFRYRDKGSLATIGRASAVADFGKIRFTLCTCWASRTASLSLSSGASHISLSIEAPD